MKNNILKIILVCIIIFSLTFAVFLIYKSNNKTIKYLQNNKSEIAQEYPITDMKVVNQVINFGSVPEDTVLKAIYTVVNTGEHPLYIEYINPDCNCTGVEYSKEAIPPKDSIKVSLLLDTKGKNGVQILHSVIKANTHDPMRRITMKVKVKTKQ